MFLFLKLLQFTTYEVHLVSDGSVSKPMTSPQVSFRCSPERRRGWACHGPVQCKMPGALLKIVKHVVPIFCFVFSLSFLSLDESQLCPLLWQKGLSNAFASAAICDSTRTKLKAHSLVTGESSLATPKETAKMFFHYIVFFSNENLNQAVTKTSP